MHTDVLLDYAWPNWQIETHRHTQQSDMSAAALGSCDVMLERQVFIKAHTTWGSGDLEGFLSCLHDDIVFTVNVEGIDYAAGAVGKNTVRERLLILLDTFEVQAFVPEWIVHDEQFSRSSVLGFYKHKKTGARLEIKVRFTVYISNDLITRFEEVHDAAYIEAFQRFVTFLQEAS